MSMLDAGNFWDGSCESICLYLVNSLSVCLSVCLC